ncbi:MAG TPA: hypothetical protein VFC99_05720 [Acidimicrobiia bacterium]|nr:hypothetical protein [Acidimicrobiia bacterium]
MSMIGVALVLAGVVVLYAQVNDVKTGDLWHALRDGGLNGLVNFTDQAKGARAKAAQQAGASPAGLTTGTPMASTVPAGTPGTITGGVGTV